MAFQILSDFRKDNSKFRLSRRSITFKIADIPETISDPEEWIKSGIEGILNHVHTTVNADDKIGFTFSSENFQNDAHLSFREARNISFDDVWSLLSKIYQSNTEGFHTDVFRLTVTTVESYKGKGRVRTYTTFEEECKQRRGIIVIRNHDRFCLPRALLVGGAYACKDPNCIRLRRNIGKEQDLAVQKLLLDSGIIIPGEGAGVVELQKFQEYFKTFKITVYEYSSRGKNVLFEGPDAEHKINLLYHRNHYNVITNLLGAFFCHYYCELCHIPYDRENAHRCESSCPCCQQRPPCEKVKEEITCIDCNRKFRGPSCFDKHRDAEKNDSVCKMIHRCSDCLKTVRTGHEHICNEEFCKLCREYCTLPHYCYIQPDNRSPRTEEVLFVFYDLETMQDTQCNNGDRIHEPNLCVLQHRCDNCLSEKKLFFCQKCGFRQKIINTNIIPTFVEHILSFKRKFRTIIVLAHNGQAFDHQFVLKYIIEKTDLKTDVILRGSKIIMLKADNLKFIDSLNYFPMPLSDLPTAFALGDQYKKGYFPHLFNTEKNKNYVGCMPDPKFYSPDTMRDEARMGFLSWYKEHSHDRFDLQKELVEYCVSDVDILTRACLKFRDMLIKECNVCPFTEATTIASACNLVFRRNFLKPNTIGLIPYNGYRLVDNQSKIALKWLIWEGEKRNINIKTALKGREIILSGFKVDGYHPEKKQIFEFQGCYYHGHECLLIRRDQPLHGNSIDTLDMRYERTQARNEKLREMGYEVIEMWECEFNEILKANNELAQYLEGHSTLQQSPLNPRDAFYGGRTGNTRTYYEVQKNEKIKFLDVNSLYPFIIKNSKMPISHPEVLLRDACTEINIMEVEGFIKCKVLPPTDLYHPVLPVKKNDKLMFLLCDRCGDMLNSGECEHLDEERAFIGTWVIDEVRRAVSKGYKIIEIYEIWKYRVEQYNQVEKTDGLFTTMMNKFMKLKAEASGWPDACSSEADKIKYLESFAEKEGIMLERNRVEKNSGLRSLAKLILNSFWGKFGQRENTPKTSIIRQPSELYNLLYNLEIDVNHVLEVNEDTLVVSWEHKNGAHDGLTTTNVAIAAYTTAQARLKLYNYLEQLGDRVLYYDTDSVIYISREGEEDLATGDFIGDLTDELRTYGIGSYITAFSSGGPKNYSYVVCNPLLNTYSTVCKVKGINLNFNARQLINFYSMSNLILGNDSASISVVTDNIRRDKHHQVLTRREKKAYRTKSEKRKFDKQYNSFPYGFRKQESADKDDDKL